MKRHKMSLSVEYVSDWGLQEALRELAQNAIDWGNWTPAINRRLGTVAFISHNAKLENASLLLGHSRKSEGSIGKFGEGYKLAMLVLARLGYKSRIVNHGEIWTPKLIDSRTYKTKQLVFDVTPYTTSEVNESLYFEVEGLKDEDFDELYRRNLHLNPNSTFFCSSKGIVLQDRPGDIFVNGLYVSTMADLKYGYNFKPEQLPLDRDRRLVRDFDVQWRTSQIWKESENFELVLSMIKEELPDVRHLDSFLYETNIGLADTAAKAFVEEHGANAVPVSSQHDIDDAKEKGHEKIVLMPAMYKSTIYHSTYYSPPPPRIIKKSPRELLLEFKDKWALTGNMCADFNVLIDKAEEWRN